MNQATEQPAFYTANILVADDNPVNREVAVGMLKRSGCTVDTAEDGLGAVAACGRSCYDLVLMDLRMPRMDGFDATCAIRRAASDSPGPGRCRSWP